MASRVYRPCFSAVLLPYGATDPGAPPCIRQRFFLLTAGDLQGLPERVLVPQRRLNSIGPVLRRWWDWGSLFCTARIRPGFAVLLPIMDLQIVDCCNPGV